MKVVIVHGGQTGVDRGAFRGARDGRLFVEGYGPKDMRDELGPIPEDVAASLDRSCAGYATRTHDNIILSDAVIIVTPRRAISSPGTRLTKKLADQEGKPCLVVAGSQGIDGVALGEFLAELDRPPMNHRLVPYLMIAGPRASKWQEGEEVARQLVVEISCV